jgi:hypothetical protein
MVNPVFFLKELSTLLCKSVFYFQQFLVFQISYQLCSKTNTKIFSFISLKKGPKTFTKMYCIPNQSINVIKMCKLLRQGSSTRDLQHFEILVLTLNF